MSQPSTQSLRERLEKLRDRLQAKSNRLQELEWDVEVWNEYENCAGEVHEIVEALLPTLESVLEEHMLVSPGVIRELVTEQRYAAYANHCAIQRKLPITWHAWKKNPVGAPVESALGERQAQSEAARAAHCICSEAYGVGPEKCGATVHHPKPPAATEGDSARELAERCVKVAKHYPSVAVDQIAVFIQRAVAQARVDEAKWWQDYKDTNSDYKSAPIDPGPQRIADLERDLAAIAKETK